MTLIVDERLADILDDGNARRGWFMNLKAREDADVANLIDYVNDYVKIWKKFDLIAA